MSKDEVEAGGSLLDANKEFEEYEEVEKPAAAAPLPELVLLLEA